jgi:hypothetical protein
LKGYKFVLDVQAVGSIDEMLISGELTIEVVELINRLVSSGRNGLSAEDRREMRDKERGGETE